MNVAATEYWGLAFEFSEMKREIEHMKELARPFLERNSPSVIDRWYESLAQCQIHPPVGETTWSIDTGWPITTKPTKAHDPGNGGRLTAYGTLSSTWEITVPARRSPHFVLTGNASTVIRICDEDTKRELACCQFDIGAAESPGCHFHTQIPQFTTDISVPRWPNLFVTPMAALEFLISELFHDGWAQHASEKTNEASGWANSQRQRLRTLVQWMSKEIECGGNPWVALRSRKPEWNLFAPKVRR